MAKQFGFEQLFRQRAAVDRHERLIMTRAGVVDRSGDDLLPGPALAINQYADIRLRHHPGLLKQAQHQRAAGYIAAPASSVAGERCSNASSMALYKASLSTGLVRKLNTPAG